MLLLKNTSNSIFFINFTSGRKLVDAKFKTVTFNNKIKTNRKNTIKKDTIKNAKN